MGVLLACGFAGMLATSPLAGCNSGVFESYDFRGGQIVMIGEMHGAEEAPSATLAFVCSGFESKRADEIVVFVEQSTAEQGVINGLVSANTYEDGKSIESIIRGSSWTAEFQDGRNSKAMLGLLRSLAALRSSGHKVSVVAIDKPRDIKGDRDEYMAKVMAHEVLEGGDDRLYVALTGNYHNMSRRGLSAADRMRSEGVPVVALRVAESGGAVWNCTAESCGVRMVRAVESREKKGMLLGQTPWGGYDGVLFLGPQEPSPPAFQSGNQTDR